MFEKFAEQFNNDVVTRYQEKMAELAGMMEKDAAPIINSNTLSNISGGSNNGFMSKLKGFFKGKSAPVTSNQAQVGMKTNKDMANYVTSRMGTPYKVPSNSRFNEYNSAADPSIITQYQGQVPQSLYTMNPGKAQSFQKGNVSGMPMTKTNPIMTGMFDSDSGVTNLMYNRQFAGQTPVPVNYNW